MATIVQHVIINMLDYEQVIKVAGICVEGLVHLFKCLLTNQITAPISSQSSIQYVSTATKVRVQTIL